MTKIKLCGLSRSEDIAIANELAPDYVGFVFAKKSKRYVDEEKARLLKGQLNSSILAVGVFVDSPIEEVARLLNEGVIDIAQLHGSESEEYIFQLRKHTDKPIIKAFCVRSQDDVARAQNSVADYVLLDSSVGGSGKSFDRELTKHIDRRYFLAGGLDPDNVEEEIRKLSPYAVDVSSGIESDGVKDKIKMTNFVNAVRKV